MCRVIQGDNSGGLGKLDRMYEQAKEKGDILMVISGIVISIIGILGLLTAIQIGAAASLVVVSFGVLLFMVGAIRKGYVTCQCLRPYLISPTEVQTDVETPST